MTLFLKRRLARIKVRETANSSEEDLLKIKGKRNGACNRSACLDVPAICFNKTMDAYYCISCARRLNETKLSDGSVLCDWPKDEDMADDGIFLKGE